MTVENEKNKLRWNKLQTRLAEASIINALKHLRFAGIEPILIKGWAISRMYPEMHLRDFQDVDLCVAPEKYAEAEKILAENGAKFMYVDLHCGLRHLDNVPWENLHDNSHLINLEETSVRILRPEDHLRIICIHWLTDGGENREKLWDIYYAVANRAEDFDWDRCLNIVGEKRRKWIVCALGLANKYLNLNLEGTPLAEESRLIPQWVIKTVENEWRSPVNLRPLQGCLNDPKEFFVQIKKRFPPNPITATIDMEGEFDDKPRIFYQLGDILFRLPKSLKSISGSIFRRNKN